MRKAYLLLGGGYFSAANPTEFVQNMRSKSLFDRSKNNEQYMKAVSERCWLYDQSVICSNNEAQFLQDLLDNDFVISVDIN